MCSSIFVIISIGISAAVTVVAATATSISYVLSLTLFLLSLYHRVPDPEATKPDDWDEDAPREILDEEAEKPEGWLDDEPEEIDDPGMRSFHQSICLRDSTGSETFTRSCVGNHCALLNDQPEVDYSSTQTSNRTHHYCLRDPRCSTYPVTN